jgi:tetratricopeptide (TPR) repeat protein
MLTLAAFLGILQNAFVNWDDPVNFLDNPRYRGLGPVQLTWMFTTFHMGHYIPLTWLTLGADYLVWGMDPMGYHLTSLLFHAATALCFYAVARRLLARALPVGTPDASIVLGAAVAALFFSVHPLRVESVAWVTARRDVVSGLFFLLALLAWLRYVEAPEATRRGWHVGSLVLFACALLSKSLAVGLPVVLVVLDVYPLRRLGGARGWLVRGVWLEKLPYLLMAAAAAVVAIAATPASAKASLEALSLGSRALVAAYGVAFYLFKTVLPMRLSPLYVFVTSVNWAVLSSLVVAVVVTVSMRRRWPALAGAGVAYVALLLPTLGFFAAGPQAVADRYSYLPCLGWALAAGGLVAWEWAGARVVRAAAAGILALLVVLTAQQVRVWHDSISLWSHAVELQPANRFARINLGGAYAAAGRTPEAIDQYREVLELSREKAPWYEVLGWLYASSGRVAEGLPLLLEALRLEPGRTGACMNAREAVRLLNVPPPPELSSCPGAGG